MDTALELLVRELAPQNFTEAALAIQMAGPGEAALMFLQGHHPGTTETIDQNAARATRLMRLHLEQIEAMQKNANDVQCNPHVHGLLLLPPMNQRLLQLANCTGCFLRSNGRTPAQSPFKKCGQQFRFVRTGGNRFPIDEERWHTVHASHARRSLVGNQLLGAEPVREQFVAAAGIETALGANPLQHINLANISASMK